MAKKAPELKRSMTAGQMEMISLGGAIGVGLFMGASSTIKWPGPSVLLAYIFVGVILYIVMRALGEMLYVDPGTGSFADYASEHVHPIAGYLAEWANVFQYIVVGISEVVATTEYLRFWWKGTSDWVAGVIIILFLLVANLASAKAYATLEFWFAMIKVVTIILMILLGFAVILFGFGNGGHPVGFSNLWSHGGFFTGGLKGFFFSMAIIVGSYEGIELIGISAGEVSDPHKAIVKSVKSVLWRILIFYVGAIFVIVTIYPWNKLDSIGSPFVTTFAKVGEYFRTGMPLISKRMTVDGDAVTEPKNVIAPIGTMISDVIAFCGGYKQEPKKILMGGPMMGRAIFSDEMPIVKNNNAILAFSGSQALVKEETACINCGRCHQACPFNLIPTALADAYERRDAQALSDLKVMQCMECGSCSYVCPARRPLGFTNKLGKALVKEAGIK